MAHATLSIGMSGGDVPILHQILIEQGFSCGEDPNGIPQVFGVSTDSAVKLFQASHDGPDKRVLSVDGIVGPDTWWALENPSGSVQGQPGQVLPDMPSQAASNPIAAAALLSAWVELHKEVFEIPDGSNRSPEIDLYTGMSGKPLTVPGPAWCAYFASWNFAKAPGGSPFGRIGGAQTIAKYCGMHIPASVFAFPSALPVKPGDLGIIANGQEHGHVVQFAAVVDDTVWTVEGNCGNAVRSKRRAIATFKYIVNFDQYAATRGL